MTQERLAELSGTGLRTIRGIETGKVARPRPSTVVLLADALGLSGAQRDRFHRAALLDRDGQPVPPDQSEQHPQEALVEDPSHHSPLAPRPRQLPAPPPMFTGRVDELAVFDQLHQESTVVITTVDGMAGIGKTALAVHAAHRIADRYPDGQLFIDLHGYTHGVAPVKPAEALDRMLRALGVPGPVIPAGLEERAALYRTRLADQRMLIVLDNAAAETQVTPLLPGNPGCLLLITSRRRLTGLDQTRTLTR